MAATQLGSRTFRKFYFYKPKSRLRDIGWK